MFHFGGRNEVFLGRKDGASGTGAGWKLAGFVIEKQGVVPFARPGSRFPRAELGRSVFRAPAHNF
jgi:hypothetical protein